MITKGELPSSGSGRYLFVDALRGVAAVLVVLHHLLHGTVLDLTLHRVLPGWFTGLCDFGDRGVEIFFVISGFVIAHSIRSLTPSWEGSGNFILRRQVRLDPPYWAVIGLTLIDTFVENRVPSLAHKPFPTAAGLFINLFYLQKVTYSLQVVPVAWTLCLEIQFYLVFMLATAIGDRLSRARTNPSRITRGLVTLSGVGCLFVVRQQAVFSPWFMAFWPYFVFGAVTYWTTHRLFPGTLFVLYAIAFSAATWWAGSTYMLVGLVTSLLLLGVAAAGRLRTLGSNVVLQYLGRLSYSLYLVHLLTLGIILRGGYKLTHENRWAALGWFITAAAASVGVADVFHRWVEVPSMSWASRLKPKARALVEVGSVAPPGAGVLAANGLA